MRDDLKDSTSLFPTINIRTYWAGELAGPKAGLDTLEDKTRQYIFPKCHRNTIRRTWTF